MRGPHTRVWAPEVRVATVLSRNTVTRFVWSGKYVCSTRTGDTTRGTERWCCTGGGNTGLREGNRSCRTLRACHPRVPFLPVGPARGRCACGPVLLFPRVFWFLVRFFGPSSRAFRLLCSCFIARKLEIVDRFWWGWIHVRQDSSKKQFPCVGLFSSL